MTTMKNDPNTCIVCHKPIPLFRDRYVIRRRFTACTGCVERRTRLHQITAPDCPITHHDAHDHADRMILTTALGAQHLMDDSRREATS